MKISFNFTSSGSISFDYELEPINDSLSETIEDLCNVLYQTILPTSGVHAAFLNSLQLDHPELINAYSKVVERNEPVVAPETMY